MDNSKKKLPQCIFWFAKVELSFIVNVKCSSSQISVLYIMMREGTYQLNLSATKIPLTGLVKFIFQCFEATKRFIEMLDHFEESWWFENMCHAYLNEFWRRSFSSQRFTLHCHMTILVAFRGWTHRLKRVQLTCWKKSCWQKYYENIYTILGIERLSDLSSRSPIGILDQTFIYVLSSQSTILLKRKTAMIIFTRNFLKLNAMIFGMRKNM